MYLDYYNLSLKPFEESPDPTFFWLSDKHKEALACLNYALVENKSFLLITGDIGTGKTSLINYLLHENEIDAVVATMVDPDLEINDFFKLLAREFGIKNNFHSKLDFLLQFEHFLKCTYSEKKKALLIIDEAHRLNQQLMEQIRLFSNIEKKNAKLISIFFVGQDEFRDLIKEEQNKALRQRITVHYSIEPLREFETQEYIKHRLRVAGAKRGFFSYSAVGEIHSFSKGYPRLINAICDRALLTGYVSNTKKITREAVKQCAHELKILIE